MLIKVCDECMKPATVSIYGMTGRVLIDGQDAGQSVDFCEDHKPRPDYLSQAHNCKRVVLYWSGGHGNNLYPPRVEE